MPKRINWTIKHLLILTAVCACVVFSVSHALRRRAAFLTTARQLEAHGAKVSTRYHSLADESQSAQFYDYITEVDLDAYKEEDVRACLTLLAACPDLVSLIGSGCDLTDDMLLPLDLPKLENLNLLGTTITNKSSPFFSKLLLLKSLDVRATETDERLTELLPFPDKLRCLHIGPGLDELPGTHWISQFKYLSELEADSRQIAACMPLPTTITRLMLTTDDRDADLSFLKSLHDIEHLTVEGGKIDAALWDKFANNKKLASLDMHGTWIHFQPPSESAGVAAGRWRKLRKLDLTGCKWDVRECLFEVLSNAVTLEDLSVRGIAISDADCPGICRLQSLRALDLSNTNVGVLGLLCCRHAPSLYRLSAHGLGLTKNGSDRLRGMLPNIYLYTEHMPPDPCGGVNGE